MAKNLRNYQKRLKAGIYAGWQQTHQAHKCATTVVACTATGSGKTVVMGNIAAELQASGMRVHGLPTVANAQGIIIAHRKELVGQISRAMAAEGLRHNLLASQTTVKEVVHSHMHALKASYYDPRSSWTVASVDTLIARGFPCAERVAFAFTDECFVAGTLIDGKPIEQIKKGDVVTAFNEQTQALEKRRVVRTFKNPAPLSLMVVTIAGHYQPLTCTFGHPFWTQRGWVEAARLMTSDSVLLVCGKWTRVASARQIGGIKHAHVYNFEVEGLHTYVANGVVVHNCHHVLEANKWGRAQLMFPNAFALGMTATPCRADGQGLGIHADGLAHALVEGPGLAELVRDGYLVNYRVLKTKPADLDLSGVHVTAGGDYNQKESAAAVKRSRQIIGDAVRIYKEHTQGKRAILFAADIEHADQMAEAFNAAGVPAKNVSGAKDTDRDRAIEEFKSGKLLVLINVDLFGEGFDVPACEVVIMCRPTKSFALYSQMVGRMLRLDISPMLMAAWDTYTVAQRLQFIAESPKPQATLIDLVGNVGNQYKVGDYDYVGLPEGFNNWTLDRRSRARGPSDGIPLRRCTNLVCGKDYERTESMCPYCGTVAPPPAQRGTVQAVDGDVFELDGELLAQMRGNVLEALEGGEKVSQSWLENDPRTAGMAKAAAESRKYAVQTLMQHIDAWAEKHGHDHAKTAKVFYYKFGMDVLTALQQSAGKCAELSARISKEY